MTENYFYLENNFHPQYFLKIIISVASPEYSICTIFGVFGVDELARSGGRGPPLSLWARGRGRGWGCSRLGVAAGSSSQRWRPSSSLRAMPPSPSGIAELPHTIKAMALPSLLSFFLLFLLLPSLHPSLRRSRRRRTFSLLSPPLPLSRLGCYLRPTAACEGNYTAFPCAFPGGRVR